MKIPKHVAIILDGNGRWAKSKGMPRNYGHTVGAKNVETVCQAADELGIEYLTLYAFSTENWNRPDSEVAALMKLLESYLKNCIRTANKNNMRVRVIGELSTHELDALKEYIAGQASDGWGEGFEQHEISVDGGELYVHLWNSDHWSIQTEQELFAPKIAEGLPELCFSTLASTGQLICVKRGENGYYPSDWDTGDKERNVELADELNENLGVSPVQRQAMEVGSMCGWDVPGADPKADEQEPMGMRLS